MTKVKDLHQKWMKSKEYRKAHAELAPEVALARAVIDARVTAGLTQEQLAQRMDTTQSVIARLEGGKTRPSTQTLQRLATATGTLLKISFERRPAAQLLGRLRIERLLPCRTSPSSLVIRRSLAGRLAFAEPVCLSIR